MDSSAGAATAASTTAAAAAAASTAARRGRRGRGGSGRGRGSGRRRGGRRGRGSSRRGRGRRRRRRRGGGRRRLLLLRLRRLLARGKRARRLVRHDLRGLIDLDGLHGRRRSGGLGAAARLSDPERGAARDEPDYGTDGCELAGGHGHFFLGFEEPGFVQLIVFEATPFFVTGYEKYLPM